MKLALDEWAELWFCHQVRVGMAPGLALSVLENFRQSLAAPPPPGPAALPRFVTQTDRYMIVELEREDGRGSTCAIFCRRCHLTSFNAGDVQQLYCGHCHQFHNS